MIDSVALLPLGLLAAALSWLGVRLIRRYARQRQQPPVDGRAVNQPPRGGGMAIVVVVVLIFMPVGLSVSDPSQVVRFALASVLIALIGFLDELRTLPRPARLLAQAAVALIFVPAAPITHIGFLSIDIVLSDPASYIVSILWIVVLTNAYNYMDGIDGLAGGQAVLASGLWVGIGLLEENPLVILLGILITGASAGFLVYNLPPASIFMGDAGSSFLGFSLAALPMLAVSRGASSRLIVAGALIVGLFLFDAAFTFARYLVKGQDRRRPYRSHLYQRLVKVGEPPRRVTFLYLLISIGFGVAGLVYWREGAWLALLFCALSCFFLFGWISIRESAARKPSSPLTL
ncbi:MAG: undecaprenyl/decaprenyl-phosphate alpha-N-acetylglucosaminyl 1-phosphate transferase [Anaerolineae bacterium]|nr:undecaprenyl/decaprenyl-phosphate alpha-N-acetylglucosaminyl 1-phosphate transferase [Anaerolineae bacterium]